MLKTLALVEWRIIKDDRFDSHTHIEKVIIEKKRKLSMANSV